jgi:integrase
VLKLILGRSRWQDWNLVLPEIPEREQRYFTEDEMRQIVNSVTGQWHALFATMTATGLRCGEVFGLHVEDLDLSSNRIFVRRSVWRGQEVTVKSKSGNRTVNIELALAEILRESGKRGLTLYRSKLGTAPHFQRTTFGENCYPYWINSV